MAHRPAGTRQPVDTLPPPCPSRGLSPAAASESRRRCSILTTSYLFVLLCRTATHSSCRDPLKAIYPRWQSFLANTSQQYFGTADYDTAHYISNALGQFTIAFETANRSRHTGQAFKPATSTAGRGEHLTGRSLLTPDEIMRLGPARPIVMIAGEPPYLLARLDYRSDPAYAARADRNPMHFPAAAQ